MRRSSEPRLPASGPLPAQGARDDGQEEEAEQEVARGRAHQGRGRGPRGRRDRGSRPDQQAGAQVDDAVPGVGPDSKLS